MKSHAEENGAWLWTRGAPEIWRFPFNIYTMAEASDFKFGTQRGFAKAHFNITPIEKSGCGFELGELPKYLGFFFSISATAALSSSR